MTCYHPLIRYEYYDKYKCQDGHEAYKARVLKLDSGEEYEDMEERVRSGLIRQRQIIPCGKCIGCRLEYSKEWATKGCLEAEYYSENWFLTITYNENHLPEAGTMIDPKTGEELGQNPFGTLKSEDMTLFIKRLRQYYERKYNHKGIRYMVCGEYGDKGARPHYHAIMYNLPLHNIYFHQYNENHETLWRCKELEEIWGKGLIVAAEVNWNTCAYVARYITKKVGIPTQEEYYKCLGVNPEFFRMSRKPGIGRQYFEDHKDDIYSKDEIIVKKYNGGLMKVKPPKYYDKLYDGINTNEYLRLKLKRKKISEEIRNLKYIQSTAYKKDMLIEEENTKKGKASALIRSKV